MAGSGEEREWENERLRTLCETLQAFAEASTDYPRLLRTVAERMVRAVSDGCAICLFAEKRESLGIAAVHHRDPAVAEAAQGYAATWLEADSDAVVCTVARTGQPLLIPTVDPTTLARHFTPDVAEFLSKVDVRSILFLPLQVSGLTLGTAVLSRNGPGSMAFDDDAVAVARTLADGAALAISNARLLDSLKRELEERKRAEDGGVQVQGAGAAQQ